MKNPFDQSVSAEDIRLVPYMIRSFEHAEYAAHAINQHDKLVEILDTYRAMHEVDGIGGQTWDCVTYTRLLDKLDKLEAALLTEEKP